MTLLSFPRFWTFSIERFWFIFRSILNGVTLKTSTHSKKLTFFVFLYCKLTFSFSTHRSLSLWSPRYPEENFVFERSDFGGRHLETALANRPCLCDVIPTDSKSAGRKKTSNWLGILHKVSKLYFKAIIHFNIFNTIIRSLEHVWVNIEMAQKQPCHNPEWQLKGLSVCV